MPKENKKNKREAEDDQRSYYLGKLGENSLRSASLNVFHDEIYVHINDFGKKKSVSMTVEEYNYLCSLNTSVNSWADYQRQYAYIYSTPATYQPAATPSFQQPAQTFSPIGPSFAPYPSVFNQSNPPLPPQPPPQPPPPPPPPPPSTPNTPGYYQSNNSFYHTFNRK